MCDTPKFKVLEAVQYGGTGPVLRIRALLGPLRTIDGHPFFPRCPDEVCYLVDRGDELLLPESALVPVERWEPCPGKHRTRNMVNEHLHLDMERLVE